ncbi:hypothetical protein D3C72_2225950 [compost metagenome]
MKTLPRKSLALLQNKFAIQILRIKSALGPIFIRNDLLHDSRGWRSFRKGNFLHLSIQQQTALMTFELRFGFLELYAFDFHILHA